MKSKIININFGGLGDHLQFSTLPEEFFKKYKKKVKTYIFENSSFRNKEIYDLVWKKNPFIYGMSKFKPNSGHLNEIKFPKNKKKNIIQNWEFAHSIKSTNKYPKIYYKPKKKIKKIFLVDLSSVSVFYTKEEIKKVSKKIMLLRRKYKDFSFLNVTFERKIITSGISYNIFSWIKFYIKRLFLNYKLLVFGNLNKHYKYNGKLDGKIKVKSLKNYCDLINSSKGIISLHHGQSHLSSAIKNQYNKKLISICIIPKKYYLLHKNNGMFIFDNINYTII